MRAESTLKNAVAIAMAAVSVAAPTALADQDLRSPDARDAGVAIPTQQDLRSPDSRDAAVQPPQSFVSADARDSGVDRPAPAPSSPVSVSVDSSDFPWVDAGIVAGLLALLTGTGIVRYRHRHTGSPAVS